MGNNQGRVEVVSGRVDSVLILSRSGFKCRADVGSSRGRIGVESRSRGRIGVKSESAFSDDEDEDDEDEDDDTEGQ